MSTGKRLAPETDMSQQMIISSCNEIVPGTFLMNQPPYAYEENENSSYEENPDASGGEKADASGGEKVDASGGGKADASGGENADSLGHDVFANNTIEKDSLIMRGSLWAAKPAAKPAEEPAEKLAEKPTENHVENPAEKSAEKPQNQGIEDLIPVKAEGNTVRDGGIMIVGPLTSPDVKTVMDTFFKMRELREQVNGQKEL